MNRQAQIKLLEIAMDRYGFGSDVTRDISSNYDVDGESPYVHIPFDLAETKYDANIKAALATLALDVSDKGISLTIPKEV